MKNQYLTQFILQSHPPFFSRGGKCDLDTDQKDHKVWDGKILVSTGGGGEGWMKGRLKKGGIPLN